MMYYKRNSSIYIRAFLNYIFKTLSIWITLIDYICINMLILLQSVTASGNTTLKRLHMLTMPWIRFLAATILSVITPSKLHNLKLVQQAYLWPQYRAIHLSPHMTNAYKETLEIVVYALLPTQNYLCTIPYAGREILPWSCQIFVTCESGDCHFLWELYYHTISNTLMQIKHHLIAV